MDLKNILSEIENRGLTGYEIAKNTSLTEAGINKILKGETKPRKTTIDVLNNYISSLATDKENVISKTKDTHKGVPAYPTDVTSHITTSFSDVPEVPEFYVDYKPFNDCTAYVNNYGDSMFPKYKNGERLAVKQIFNLDVVNWGETYLVVTNGNANDLRTIKDIHPHEDFDKIILKASNPNYAGDTIINKSDILSMFAVKGKISQNFI